MSAVINSLCRKEFHELKWAVAAAAAIALAIPLSYVGRGAGAVLAAVHMSLWTYPLFAGVIFGMRAAAGERAGRTASFVAALPASIHLLGAVSISAALVAACAPLVLLLLTGLAISPLVDASHEGAGVPLGEVFGLSVLATTCCIAVVALSGLGQPSEMRAGAVGFAAIIVTWFVGFLALAFLMSWLLALQLIQGGEAERWWPIMALSAAVIGAILLIGLFIWRYSRAVEPIVHRERWWAIGGWMPAQLRSPTAALAWKGIRESGTLGAQVFLAAALLSVAVAAIVQQSDSRALMRFIASTLSAFLLAGGFLLALLVGVGAVTSDLQPGVNTFWRSRPISASAWYWTRYGIGLVTLLVAIELPLLFLSPSASNLTDRGMFWLMLLWNSTFSFALTAACLVRLPAHAAVLAIGAAAILYAAIEGTFGSFMPGEPPAPLAILAPAFVVALAVSTFVGWWAAVRDVAIA
jgi:hypothetical protein